MRFGYHRHLTGLTIFFFLAILLSAQTWAPIGAKWTYQRPPSPLFSYWGITELIAEKDTVLDNIPCKKLIRKWTSRAYPDQNVLKTGFDPPIYIYEDSGRVYSYLTDSFYLSYDFSLAKGDTLTVYHEAIVGSYVPGWVSTLLLDSTGISYINGIPRIYQEFSEINYNQYVFSHGNCPNYWPWRGKAVAVEGIGWTYYFTPVFAASDYYMDGHLICYQDSVLGLVSCSQRACDSLPFYITGVTKIDLNSIEIIKESSEILLIKLSLSETLQLKVTDIQGRTVIQKTIQGTMERIGIGHLPKGTYIVNVYSGSQYISQKIVR